MKLYSAGHSGENNYEAYNKDVYIIFSMQLEG
jgi:hypothetical protein